RTAAMFHRMLQPNGLLVVGDVVPPDASAVSDAWALLRFGWQDGFLCAAILGLIRTFFSDYWRLRTKVGLTRYSERGMAGQLGGAGFAGGGGPPPPRPLPQPGDLPRRAGAAARRAPARPHFN